VARGRVRKFAADNGLKIPHMGWNEAQWDPRAAALTPGLQPHVYFVHSYYPDVQDESLIACRTTYGSEFASGIIKPNLVAVQFHPEKSQATGLSLLRNSVGDVPGAQGSTGFLPTQASAAARAGVRPGTGAGIFLRIEAPIDTRLRGDLGPGSFHTPLTARPANKLRRARWFPRIAGA